MIDLDKYITNDFIKNSLMKSSRYITNESELRSYVLDILDGNYSNAIFEDSNLKRRFFNYIDYYSIDANIINCNSSLGRFCESINDKHDLNIFCNVNKCISNDILRIIQNTKGILIC